MVQAPLVIREEGPRPNSPRFPDSRARLCIPALSLLDWNLNLALTALSLASGDPVPTLATLQMRSNCSGVVPLISIALTKDGYGDHSVQQRPIRRLSPDDTYAGLRGKTASLNLYYLCCRNSTTYRGKAELHLSHSTSTISVCRHG